MNTESSGIQSKRTSFRSPWQNGVAELWVGNCRQDLLERRALSPHGIHHLCADASEAELLTGWSSSDSLRSGVQMSGW